MSTFSIRSFDPSEWELIRDLRLYALKTAPGVFATPYESAAARRPADWQSLASGPAHQIFGLFEAERLIGISAVFRDREDDTGQTAILAMSYILPAYRGLGLSHKLYEARFDWIRARSQFCRVIVSHRRSNEASRRANQRHGFVEIGITPRTWPDGETEEEITYQLSIFGRETCTTVSKQKELL